MALTRLFSLDSERTLDQKTVTQPFIRVLRGRKNDPTTVEKYDPNRRCRLPPLSR